MTEWVPEGQTVNQHYYLTVLATLREWFRTSVLENASCSPDLAPCDFYLFPKIKSALKGIRFESMEEMKPKLAELQNGLMKTDFQHCLEQWKKRLKRDLDLSGFNHCKLYDKPIDVNFYDISTVQRISARNGLSLKGLVAFA
ncbi:Hypothetical protein CINCED_3A004822 [Cinara cedri]|uniref:Mariner Mos1 transposase n=1 Tax=Cinara cedri TaxID=506608 RepID=A0A5E4NBS0_9HEMI|nr:Hypothetical protein CINCED_3A004822 [Cinara cedri]